MITPEYLHLALNHIPFLGAGFALVPLVIGLFSGRRSAVLAGLLIAVLSGWATPIVMETGEAAYERYEHGPVAKYLDPAAENAMEIHEHRAEDWAKAMLAGTVVSSLCLGMLVWKPRWTRGLACVSAVACVLTLASGIWIAQSGGPIRRPDFRTTASVPSGAETLQGGHEEENGH
jgi:hypothetical protein